MNTRSIAFQWIIEALRGKGETDARSMLGDLASDDRAFVQNLVLGTFREWGFLEFILNGLVPKKPREKIKSLILMSAYSMLFQDKVPVHAVYSEAKKLAQTEKFSVPEQKFVHGVLKKFESRKSELLKFREKSLNSLLEKTIPEQPVDWAVLNLNPEFFKTMGSNLQVVLKMKEKSSLTGYVFNQSESFRELAAENVRSQEFIMQGHSSHVFCKKVAEEIQRSKTDPLTVCEVASGKGGKFLGILHHLKPSKVLHWTAVDSSLKQMLTFKSHALPKALAKFGEMLQVELQTVDFLAVEPSKNKYDFILVDAPCTGFGTLSKHPQISLTRGKNAMEAVQQSAELQKKMVLHALQLLKPEGKLIYSVCTLTVQETLEIKALLKNLKIEWELRIEPKEVLNADGFYAFCASK